MNSKVEQLPSTFDFSFSNVKPLPFNLNCEDISPKFGCPISCPKSKSLNSISPSYSASSMNLIFESSRSATTVPKAVLASKLASIVGPETSVVPRIVNMPKADKFDGIFCPSIRGRIPFKSMYLDAKRAISPRI